MLQSLCPTMDWYSMTAFQVRVAVVGGGTGEALAAAGITPGFTATKVSCLGSHPGVTAPGGLWLCRLQPSTLLGGQLSLRVFCSTAHMCYNADDAHTICVSSTGPTLPCAQPGTSPLHCPSSL